MLKHLSSMGVLLAVMILSLFGIFGVIGMFAAFQSAAEYGMPITDTAGELFFRVYLSRNLVIVFIGLALLLQKQWRALATLFTVAIALPVFDLSILLYTVGTSAPLGFHIFAIFLLSTASILLWKKAAQQI